MINARTNMNLHSLCPFIAVCVSSLFLISCTTNQLQENSYTDIVVLKQGQSSDSNTITQSACSSFSLSANNVAMFFNNALTPTHTELHYEYDILPCYSEGTLLWEGKLYNWRIRAGGTGVLSTDKETINKACSEAACSNIPNLH